MRHRNGAGIAGVLRQGAASYIGGYRPIIATGSASCAFRCIWKMSRTQAQAVAGEIALSDGDAAGAERAFDEAPAIAGHAPAWWHSRARAALGRFEDAATDLETAGDRCAALEDEAGARRAAIEAATAWHRARRFDRATALIATTSAQARAAHDEAALGDLELLNATAALERRDAGAARAHARAARTHALAARAPDTYIGAALALSRLAEQVNDDATAYGTLASVLGDGVGPAGRRSRARRVRAAAARAAAALGCRTFRCGARGVVRGGAADAGLKRQRKSPEQLPSFGAHLNAAMHFAGMAKFLRGFFCREACAFCGHIVRQAGSTSNLVGAIGLEPTTPTMSRWCSNQLSYAPARPLF